MEEISVRKLSREWASGANARPLEPVTARQKRAWRYASIIARREPKNNRCWRKLEIRNAKSETNPKSEEENRPGFGGFLLRISDLFRISRFGFPICLTSSHHAAAG